MMNINNSPIPVYKELNTPFCDALQKNTLQLIEINLEEIGKLQKDEKLFFTHTGIIGRENVYRLTRTISNWSQFLWKQDEQCSRDINDLGRFFYSLEKYCEKKTLNPFHFNHIKSAMERALQGLDKLLHLYQKQEDHIRVISFAIERIGIIGQIIAIKHQAKYSLNAYKYYIVKTREINIKYANQSNSKEQKIAALYNLLTEDDNDVNSFLATDYRQIEKEYQRRFELIHQFFNVCAFESFMKTNLLAYLIIRLFSSEDRYEISVQEAQLLALVNTIKNYIPSPNNAKHYQSFIKQALTNYGFSS